MFAHPFVRPLLLVPEPASEEYAQLVEDARELAEMLGQFRNVEACALRQHLTFFAESLAKTSVPAA